MSIARFLAASLLATTLSVQADPGSATLTVDNVYGLYTGNGSASNLTLWGQDPDWFAAESWAFAAGAGDYVYVAGWDQGGPNGFQGLFTVGVTTTYTNLVDWVATTVSPAALPGWNTGLNTVPALVDLQAALATATWVVPQASAPANNGTWGNVVGNVNADWIWIDSLNGEVSDGHLVVFRTLAPVVAVPEPSSLMLMLLGAGGVAAALRRRRA